MPDEQVKSGRPLSREAQAEVLAPYMARVLSVCIDRRMTPLLVIAVSSDDPDVRAVLPCGPGCTAARAAEILAETLEAARQLTPAAIIQ